MKKLSLTLLAFIVLSGSASALLIKPASININELLPRPNGNNRQFIELHNNTANPINITGYHLFTTLHPLKIYTFPASSWLAGNVYEAFYSNQTKLNLDNYSDVVILTDSYWRPVNQTPAYVFAKLGFSWSAGSHAWYWDNKPTPGKVNQP